MGKRTTASSTSEDGEASKCQDDPDLSVQADIFDGLNKHTVFDLSVGFFHRSLRDFLLTPKIQQLLHSYSHGPFDERNFLRNARLSQSLAVVKANCNVQLAVWLTSYCVSTLSVPNFRSSPIAVAFL